MKILIATSLAPKSEDNFHELCHIFRNLAVQAELEIPQGILWTGGPGCSNLAFEVKGPEDVVERFASNLTLALMPSRWTDTKDPLPEKDTCKVFC